MRRAAAVLAPALVISACASVQTGEYARPLGSSQRENGSPVTAGGVAITGREIPDLSNPYLGAIELTLENRSGDWIRIEDLKLDFGSEEENRRVRIPWGYELASWQEAQQHLQTIRAHNEAVAAAVFGTALGMAALAGGHDGLRAVGAFTAGMTVLATFAAAGAAAEQASRPQLFPDTHLMALPIAIPPGLFVKRWILLNTLWNPSGPCLQTMSIDYRMASGRHEAVALRFRERNTTSRWQSEACGRRN